MEGLHYGLCDDGQPTLTASMMRHGAIVDLAIERGQLSKEFARTQKDSRYSVRVNDIELSRRVGGGQGLPGPVRFYGFPDEALDYYEKTGLLADLTFALESRFRRLFYVGPIRDHPMRSYLWAGDDPDHVGTRGERAVEAMLAAHGRRIAMAKESREVPFDELIARWLRDLGLIHSFDVRPIGAGREDHEVLIRVREGSSEVHLTDVGFGVSQLLPVIVECFYVPRSSTVIFEQPDLHLHPSAQAGLADLFIGAIKAHEDNAPRRQQLVVESHSEHFLRRLQRRIAEQQITRDDVAIYFCEPSRDGSRLSPIDVDEFGNIRNWPGGFFGDEMGDLVAMTEAEMQRTMATGE